MVSLPYHVVRDLGLESRGSLMLIDSLQSVISSLLTHLHFLSRFSRLVLQNPIFLVPLDSLLFWASIQVKKLANPISHEGAISFSE
jgi:hypothetical protein